MQPNDPEQQWQQPSAAQSGAPYVAPPVEPSQPVQPQAAPTPVVPVVPVAAPMPAQQPVAPQPLQTPSLQQNPVPLAPVVETPPEPVQSAQVSPAENIIDEQPTATDARVEASVQSDQDVEPEDDDTSAVDPLIRWQASEYVQRDRSLVWYIVLGIVTVALTAVALWWMKTVTFAILVPVMAVALVVYTRRAPNMVNYVLSKKGFYVNDKLYPYADFKAFSVLSHDGAHSFQLIPRKRFQIGQTAYFTDDIGESIVDMLAARLPMKDDKPDMYDRLTSKLKM